MAKKLHTIVVDDMDPSVVAEHSVVLSFEGESVDLDLSTENLARLRAELEPWLTAGRRHTTRRIVRRVG